MTRRALVLVLTGSLSLAGCQSAREPTSAETMATDVRSADAVLQSGTWKLVSYVPEVALEPMLATLLQAEVQTMVVRFENGRMKADGPGVHVDRSYRIEQAWGPRFKLVSVDETGVAYSTTGEISTDGNWIAFVGENKPWRGVGTLHRVP